MRVKVFQLNVVDLSIKYVIEPEGLAPYLFEVRQNTPSLDDHLNEMAEKYGFRRDDISVEMVLTLF